MRVHDTWGWHERRQATACVCGVGGLLLAAGSNTWWLAAVGIALLGVTALLAQ